jgi:anion-transporting  ArsA/GET3 family ATPase
VDLKHLIHTSQVLVVVGSGGVGKTTSASGLALFAAREGKRVALLTIDPAKRLAQALGLESLNNTPQSLAADLTAPGDVAAMMLEPSETFDNLISQAVQTDALRERLLANRLYQLIARTLGGMQEYMAVEKLYDLVEQKKFDLIVIDTPPSVNALVFLDAPRRMYTFFSETIVRFFVKENEIKKKGLLGKMKDKAGEIAINVLRKTLSDSFMDDLMEMATAFQSLFAAFRLRGEVVEKILRAKETNFVIVTGPDPLRVSEAEDYSHILRKLGVRPDLWIVNRVHESPKEDVRFNAEEVNAWLSEFEKTAPETTAPIDGNQLCSELNTAIELALDLKHRDDRGLSEIQKLLGKASLIQVEAFTDEVEDGKAVEQFIKALKRYN